MTVRSIVWGIALGLFLMVVFAFTGHTQEIQSTYKATKLSPTAVGVVCRDGGTPVVEKTGSIVIVSCPILVSRKS